MTSPVVSNEELQRQVTELKDQLADLGRRMEMLQQTQGQRATDDPALLALANIALLEDRHPTHTTSVQSSASTKFTQLTDLLGNPDPREAICMLATYCFDVSKRFAVLHEAVHKVLKPTNVPGDSTIAERLSSEDRELNDPDQPGMSWSRRAEIAARQLKYWHHDIDDGYVAFLKFSIESQR